MRNNFNLNNKKGNFFGIVFDISDMEVDKS